MWANSNSNGYADIKPNSNLYSDRNANCASHGNTDSYTYSAVYGYTYTYGNANLHTALHIHRGDRNDRSGHNRYRQSR